LAKLIFSFGLAGHTKENHLLLAHILNLLAGKYATDASLRELSCGIFFFLLSHFDLLLATLASSLFLSGLGDLLINLNITKTTLPTTLILLNQTNG